MWDISATTHRSHVMVHTQVANALSMVVQNDAESPKVQSNCMKSRPMRKTIISDFRLEVEILAFLHMNNEKMVKNNKVCLN